MAATSPRTNWTLSNGNLARLSAARRQVLDAKPPHAPPAFDANAMALWELIGRFDACVVRAMTPLDSLRNAKAAEPSAMLRAWLGTHPRLELGQSISVLASGAKAVP